MWQFSKPGRLSAVNVETLRHVAAVRGSGQHQNFKAQENKSTAL